MADTKFSALTAATAAADANEIAINEAGTSKKLSLSLLKAWNGGMLRNASTSAQSPSAGATTYLTGSSIAVPSGLLRVGTVFRWRLIYTKTAAGTAARSHLIKIGTAGTTGDATIITLASLAGTAATDTGHMDIIATVRGPLSASCIMHAGAFVSHNSTGTTGLSATNEVECLSVTSSTWDATTANLIVGLAITAGASEALTYPLIFTEAFNL